MAAHRYLGPKDLHGPWHGDNPYWAHKCRNGKIAHTHLGLAPCQGSLRFAHVVCEPWGPICIIHIPYTVHWPICPACTGGLTIVHGGQ